MWKQGKDNLRNIEHIYLSTKSLQLCSTLCHHMDYSLPGSSVHGVLQARILEWIAVPSSRGSSWLRDQHASLTSPAWQADSLPLAPPGNPHAGTTKSIKFSPFPHKVCNIVGVEWRIKYNYKKLNIRLNYKKLPL